MKMKINLRKLGRTFLIIIPLIIMIYLYDTIGIMNTLGLYLLFYLGFFLYKMFVHRDVVLANIRQIEASIWGKPLDKSMWIKGEIQTKKVKVVWRKPK